MDIEQVELSNEQLDLDRQFLDACSRLDRAAIESHLSADCDAWFQDPVTGEGPLHRAVIAGDALGKDCIEVLDLLLSNGAVWNQMARNGETPGCTARRLYGASSAVYETLLNAGVRAELLLTALQGRTARQDGNGEDDLNQAYLTGKVEYTAPTEDSITLLDEQHNAVMMTWESDIMVRSAQVVVPVEGEGSVLNIGFGLGLIDTAIQTRHPSRHVIIEAHPDVLKEMRRLGWYEKPGVEILEGRWQDVVDSLADRETFDGIYYDPFEYWDDMHQFFDAVVALLNPDGVFSFFHGLGADNQTFYDVYTRILEIELSDFGMTTVFEEMDVQTKDEEWSGAKRRYWKLQKYRLPTCKFMQ